MHQSQLYFNQYCPVCGRGMRVRIELLGKKIACGHCTSVTVACDERDHQRAGAGHKKVTVGRKDNEFEIKRPISCPLT